MEYGDLLNRVTLENALVNPKGGTGLTISFIQDAMTPEDFQRTRELNANKDHAASVMAMLEIYGLEWDMKIGGQPVLPFATVPEDIRAECERDSKPLPPTLARIKLSTLVAVLNKITEFEDPKEEN